ncbi:MAG TPA: peptidylprolyl isomerase [Candidatus Baltobacteraceae bacterium]|nr:peptidylprolyl isomerase [Candidatus Baltobacteraceae bacterium]
MSYAFRAIAGLSTVLLGLTLAACSAGSAGTGGNVASVNGQPVTRSEYDDRLEAGPQGKAVLNQLIQRMLIDQYAKDNKIDIPASEVQKKEDEIRGKYPAGQFDQMLKAQNLTEADVQGILREQLILEKAVGAQVQVSNADVEAYLAKNHATLDTGEQVRARHILVPDEKTANEVEAQLKAGAKFEDMAKKYSTDPSSKDKGGELGFFAKGQMVPAFQNAAFSQPLNVVGPPVKSPFGYHIIEVEEKKPATIATMANSGEKIKAQLTQQKEQQAIPVFMQTLRQKAKIDIYDPRLKDALPPATPQQPGSQGAPPAGQPAPATK